MSTLTIRHDYEGGTVVEDTTRDSPAHAALKAHRSWTWSRYAGAWLLRSSRHRRPKRGPIAEMTEILTRLGYTVEQDIDDTMPGMVEQEADLADRMEARQDRLEERAQRMAGRCAASQAKADAVFGNIPFGQPLLPGHHSYAADLRRRERAWKNFGRSVEQNREAGRLAAQAESTSHHMGARYNPVTVGNRIQKLEADERRLRRELDAGPTPDRAAELGRFLAEATEQLDFWRAVHADLQESGKANCLGPDTVAVGDLVATPVGWLPVRRVNPKSVTVPNPIFPVPRPGQREYTSTYPYHKITGHRPASTTND